MAIRLHSFISSDKRYVQVENQPHHIIGVFKNIIRAYNKMYFCQLNEIENTSFVCEEDGTVTFYQAATNDHPDSGIWTYLVYDCPPTEEKVFRDASIDTSTYFLEQLLSGQKLVQFTEDICEYLRFQLNQDEYLDVRLPITWATHEGRVIADLLVEEMKAFQSSSVFAEGAGREYMTRVLSDFIEAAQDIVVNGGTIKDFEETQHEILHKIRIDEIANLIIEYNDYRIWQAALPSKSKAVEYAFNNALILICRIK